MQLKLLAQHCVDMSVITRKLKKRNDGDTARVGTKHFGLECNNSCSYVNGQIDLEVAALPLLSTSTAYKVVNTGIILSCYYSYFESIIHYY